MTHPKPSDLPHQVLREAKHPTPLERSVNEVEDLLYHFRGQGYNVRDAIQLTDITLSNIQDGA